MPKWETIVSNSSGKSKFPIPEFIMLIFLSRIIAKTVTAKTRYATQNGQYFQCNNSGAYLRSFLIKYTKLPTYMELPSGLINLVHKGTVEPTGSIRD